MMTTLQLFDSVRIREAVSLDEGAVAPAGTLGAVVELLAEGEAYMVELFGEWVKFDNKGNIVPTTADDPEAFAETLGVATVSVGQIEHLSSAEKAISAKTHLLSIVEELPEQAVLEVANFAEFLRQKQQARELA